MNKLQYSIINLTLSGYYDYRETLITLNTGDGVILQDPTYVGSFDLIWWNSSDYQNPYSDPFAEIVRCIVRYNDTLVIMRGQEGTLPSSKNMLGKIYKMAPVAPVYISPDIGTLSFYNAPQTHGKIKHDSTSIDGGATLSSNTQIPAHGSSQHTVIIGDHATQLTNIGTNPHTAIDTHISTNLIGIHGISGTPATGQIVTATSPTTATWQSPATGVSPATSVTQETSFNIPSNVGTSNLYARGDHTHGTPSDTPFEHIIYKNQPSGYAGLNPNTLVWPLQIYTILESYINHIGATDNFTQTSLAGSGTATADSTNHMMTLSTGITSGTDSAVFQSKKTWVLGTSPIIVNFLIQGISGGSGGSGKRSKFGLSDNLTAFSTNGAVISQDNNGAWAWYVLNGGLIESSGSISTVSNGDLFTIVATSSSISFYRNGTLLGTGSTSIPTAALYLGASVVATSPAGAVTLSIDLMSITVYK